VIFLTRTHLLGLAPQKGEVLWEVPYKVKYEQNVVTPSVAGDMVFIAGWEEPTLGLKLTSSQDKLAATQVWSNADVTFFMNSPVFCGGHLYGLAQEGKGSLACIDAASGKIVWRSEGGMGEYASIVSAGDKLLVLADKGVLRVVAADPRGYKELQSLKASASPVWSHLAVTSDRLFIKSKTHLSCHALKAE
jgi:outer membrane protein assembly factor BamB